MRTFLITIIITFCIFAAKAQQPAFEWAIQCGNPPNITDTKSSLAINPQGGIYMAGDFVEQAQFGDKDLIAAGGTDIFLVSYDTEGNPVWANRIGAADYEFTQHIIIDNDGDIIVAGYFYGSTQIGNDTYTSFGSQDIFFAKFDGNGDFIWSFRAGGQMADYISGISVDSDRNVVVTGYFYGQIYFGDSTLSAAGSSDVFIAKLDPSGNLVWASTAGGSSSDQSRALSCDPDNNIMLTGSFYDDIMLGDTTLTTENPVGVFIARYFPDGQLNWVIQLDGSYLTPDVYIASDHSGNCYVSGNFSEQIVFGNNTFEAGEFNQDVFLVKYNMSGEVSWARHIHSFSSDQVIDLTVDIYNNVYLTGHYLDTIHFNSLTLPYTLCCGSREIFMANYSAGGEVRWVEKISGARASIHDVEIGSQGEMFLSGKFTEEILFGPLSLSNFDGYKNFITCLQTDMYTSAPELADLSGFRIYPNPSAGHFYVQLQDDRVTPELLIYSMSGSLVLSQKVRNGDMVDIRNLHAGQYILLLRDQQASGLNLNGRIIRL